MKSIPGRGANWQRRKELLLLLLLLLLLQAPWRQLSMGKGSKGKGE